MSVFIQTPEVYAVDGANIYVQGPPFISNIDPTVNDSGPVGQTWINRVSKVQWVLTSNTFPNTWVIDAAPSQFMGLTDQTGAEVTPDGVGDIQITAGAGITVLKTSANQLTVAGQNTAVVTGQTTNATPLSIYSFAIPTNTGYAFEALVHGMKSDYTDAASFFIMRGIRRGAGAPVLIGALSQQVCSDAPVGVTCDVSLSGNNVQLTVTGLLASTYNWSASLRWVQVS